MKVEHVLTDKKDVELVNEYIQDKDEFVKNNPDLAVKALELYNKYLELMTKYYIMQARAEMRIDKQFALRFSPFGIYSMRR